MMIFILSGLLLINQAQADNAPAFKAVESLRDEIAKIKSEIPELKNDPEKMRAAMQDLQIAAFQLYLTMRLEINPKYPQEWKDQIPKVIAHLKENRKILNRVEDIEEPSFFESPRDSVSAWIHLLPGFTKADKAIYFGVLRQDYFKAPPKEKTDFARPYFEKAKEIYKAAFETKSAEQLAKLDLGADDLQLAQLSRTAMPSRILLDREPKGIVFNYGSQAPYSPPSSRNKDESGQTVDLFK